MGSFCAKLCQKGQFCHFSPHILPYMMWIWGFTDSPVIWGQSEAPVELLFFISLLFDSWQWTGCPSGRLGRIRVVRCRCFSSTLGLGQMSPTPLGLEFRCTKKWICMSCQDLLVVGARHWQASWGVPVRLYLDLAHFAVLFDPQSQLM